VDSEAQESMALAALVVVLGHVFRPPILQLLLAGPTSARLPPPQLSPLASQVPAPALVSLASPATGRLCALHTAAAQPTRHPALPGWDQVEMAGREDGVGVEVITDVILSQGRTVVLEEQHRPKS